MNLTRISKHLCMGRRHIKRSFPTLTRIEQAITQSETQHCGQIRFAVEAALDWSQLLANRTARDRAVDVFSQLRIWDTEHNNGVLIYLLLADRDVEIIADRGICAKLNDTIWQQICADMEQSFRQGQFEQGVISGIQAITQYLSQHFPHAAQRLNELPDSAVVL